MEANELISAFDHMVKSGTPINEATIVLNTAVTGVTPSEDLVLRDLQARNPGLAPDEYQALLNTEFPEDEDNPVIRKAKIQTKAIELAKAQQEAALARIKGFIPSSDEATRRAELAKAWAPKASEAVQTIEIAEGIALNLDAEAKKAIAQQLAAHASQQGWEVSDDNTDLKDHALRIALFMSGPKGVNDVLQSLLASEREKLVREFAAKSPMGSSPRPVKADLPAPRSGFV